MLSQAASLYAHPPTSAPRHRAPPAHLRPRQPAAALASSPSSLVKRLAAVSTSVIYLHHVAHYCRHSRCKWWPTPCLVCGGRRGSGGGCLEEISLSFISSVEALLHGWGRGLVSFMSRYFVSYRRLKVPVAGPSQLMGFTDNSQNTDLYLFYFV